MGINAGLNPFASHEAVNHSIHECVRGNVHTNTIEGFFSETSYLIRISPSLASHMSAR